MKSNELMIGDWVMQDDNLQQNRACQITGIYDNVVVEVTSEKVPLHESHIEPIPLTAEILERNGLRRKEAYEKYEWREGYVEVRVILGDSGEEGEKKNVIHIENGRRGIPVHYHNTIAFVHELQHALRQCGIEKEIEL